MRRKPKTESQQRNNQSLNTVGVPASAHPLDRTRATLSIPSDIQVATQSVRFLPAPRFSSLIGFLKLIVMQMFYVPREVRNRRMARSCTFRC